MPLEVVAHFCTSGERDSTKKVLDYGLGPLWYCS
ncbi:hypothetical protein DFP77_11521 [Marinomonas foliarum]|jgi:hypothetical protein|uniref:Uncharacterized protein n=1 Tax=Marinomonas foliarum TaxID=491950 RepID=A0A369A184_9GAMM|nr:hypothetical protein DFP77_11521 [Marinomonas foliarum]